jgi:hypothetical protein
VDFRPPPNEGTFSGFSVGPFQPPRDSGFRDFDQWIRDFKRALTAAGDTILSEVPLKVSGYRAVRITHTNSVPGTTIDILVGVPGQPTGQVFQFVYAPPGNNRYRQEQALRYQRIISSLKISPPR